MEMVFIVFGIYIFEKFVSSVMAFIISTGLEHEMMSLVHSVDD